MLLKGLFHTIVFKYSSSYLRSPISDEEWTKEETDYLFALVKEYDMRWYVIIDRYEFEGGLERALEVRILLLRVCLCRIDALFRI